MTEAEAIKTQMAVLATNVGHLADAVEKLEEKIVSRVEHQDVSRRVDKLENQSTWVGRGLLVALAGAAANALGLHWK